MNQILAEYGIQDLGGDSGGLNLEIEYYDLEGNYREAAFAVRDIDTLEIVTIYQPSKHEVVLWIDRGGNFESKRIRFSNGVNYFVDFRLPTCCGAQSIMERIVQGSPDES